MKPSALGTRAPLTPGPAQGVKSSIFASVIVTGVLKVSPLTSISTVFPFAHSGTDMASENNRQQTPTTRLRISPPVQPAAPHYINRALIGSIHSPKRLLS